MPMGNEPGSYFRIIYGPVGYYGLPTFMAIIILIVIIVMFSAPLVDSVVGHGYRPAPTSGPIP